MKFIHDSFNLNYHSMNIGFLERSLKTLMGVGKEFLNKKCYKLGF